MHNETQTKKRCRGGRPQLPADHRRGVRVTPGFTLAEYEELEKRAAALGLSEVAEWLRIAGLGQTVKSVPAINRALYSELGKAQTNINTLARAVNSGSLIHNEALNDLLITTSGLLAATRRELLGTGMNNV